MRTNVWTQCDGEGRKVEVLTLSTSLVKGLVEFQLHHFLCSGGRKSWKVRTLHALGRALAPPSAADLELPGEAESGVEGQSPAGPVPVSLWRRNRSRCWKKPELTEASASTVLGT